MAMAMARSGLRSSIRAGTGAAPRSGTAASRRSFSSYHMEDDLHESDKWKKITVFGVTVCTLYGIYLFRKDNDEYKEQPPYEYLHIRNKEYPWGPDSLFETIFGKHHSKD